MHKLYTAFLVLSLGLFTMPATMAQDEEPIVDENVQRCINLRRVRSTDVIDDRNILFYMRGGEVFHNILPRTCNGLAREGRFSYRTSVNRICDIDSIAVLHDGVRGMYEGARCGLGMFHEISPEDARAMKEDPSPAPEPNPLPMPEPEEVDDEDDESKPPG